MNSLPTAGSGTDSESALWSETQGNDAPNMVGPRLGDFQAVKAGRSSR